jgi:hypothetical protein
MNYQTIKTSLKSVVRDAVVIEKLQDATTRANAIMIHGLHVLKLYLLHCYETNVKLPVLDKDFVKEVLKLSCRESGRPVGEKTAALRNVLRPFYLEHYREFVSEEVSATNLDIAMSYMTMEVITMYENNVKAHFVEYVERFVNVSCYKANEMTVIKISDMPSEEKKTRTNALCAQLRKIKTDLLSPDQEKKSDVMYHAWIEEQRPHIMPSRPLNKGVYYDLKCSPQDYLPCMIYMMRAVERRGDKVSNVFPLRSDLVPKHFRLDTATLINLCMTKEHGEGKGKSFYLSKGNLVLKQREIWNFFFKTHLKCFHIEPDAHGYTFDHMVETDGVSISILLVRKGFVGKMVKKPKLPPPKAEQYIDELPDYTNISSKKLVAIDPNMSDLLYCVDDPGVDKTIYRYTQDTRRKDMYVKKHRNYLRTEKRRVVDGRSVNEWEAQLSTYNKKTTSFASFKVYVEKKNAMNVRLLPFYEEYTFRRMKMLSFIGRQRTDAKMIREFKAKFGSGEEAVIAIGDWEQRKHTKFKEPVKGKGFRTLLRKAGYQVYLVDEFRTSCRCSDCEEHGECKTFKECDNPRPYRTGRILRHGLVRCKTCQRLWNRDTNASSNIWKVADCAIKGLPRPAYLQRTNGSFRPASRSGSIAIASSSL